MLSKTRYYFVIIFLLLLSSAAYTQCIKIGLSIGRYQLNKDYSATEEYNVIKSEFGSSLSFGLTANYYFANPLFRIYSNIQISSLSGDGKYYYAHPAANSIVSTVKTKSNSFSVNLGFNYNILDNFISPFIGPYVSYYSIGKINIENPPRHIPIIYGEKLFGGGVKAGIDFIVSKLLAVEIYSSYTIHSLFSKSRFNEKLSSLNIGGEILYKL